MKKLLYLFLLPSVLFSQTTPSVTPRADGEGSLGTETYRWGEGHFDELYTEAPSLSDDSNRVPTTSWVNDIVNTGGDTINYIYKAASFTAEPNKKYTVNTLSGDVTITLPKLSEIPVASSIVIRHANGTNNIIINRAGLNVISEGGPYSTSFTFKGIGSETELAAYDINTWLITRSGRTIEPPTDSDTNVAATTAWVNDLVEDNLSGYLKKNSYPSGFQKHTGELMLESDWGGNILTLHMPDYGSLHTMWGLDYDGTVDIRAQDFSPFASKLLMSFKDIFTSSPYTEFVQPVKAPTPAAADDSTNVATTSWVQDEIAEGSKPRVDGEGSLGTETYRWGEGHFDELYVEVPSLSDDSNRVPTTSWVNNLVQAGGDTVSYTAKNSSFTAEPNKKYVVETMSGDITITLPELSEELKGSSISIRHYRGSNNIIINRSGTDLIVDGASNLSSFTFKGSGSEVDLVAFTVSAWVITKSNRTIEPAIGSDTNVAATTAWVNDLVEDNVSNINTSLSGYLKKNSYPTGYQTYKGELILDSDWGEKILTLDMPDYGNLNTMWTLDNHGTIDVVAEDYDPANSETLLSFKDIFTSSPYTEFVQPVKAPTPAAADDSTNVATTEFVQDGLTLKQDKFSYSYRAGGTINPGVVGNFYGFGGSGTIVLPLASTCSQGDQIAVMVATGTDSVTINRSGSDQFITPVGSATSYSLTGRGASIVMVRVTDTAWAALGAPDSIINNKAAGALLTEATPASSSATGTKGMIRYDSTYVYVCVATDTWIRFEKDPRW